MHRISDTNEAIDIAKKYICSLKNTVPIHSAYLFGSYAKGNFNKESDIDIAIFTDYFKDQLSGETFLLEQANKLFPYIDIQPILFFVNELYGDNIFVKEVLERGIKIL